MLHEAGVIALEFILVAVTCALLLWYYKGQLVTPDVAVSVYLSWVLGFGGILILPYDLSVALVSGVQSPHLVSLWTAIYWSTFFLAWIILPIQMEYHSSGHFTVASKLKDAFMRLLLALILTVAAVIFYIIYNVAFLGGSVQNVLSFMMAMGNTYGVLLITLLMGTGLVGIPKRLWLIGDTEGELNRLYISASGIEESYQNARYELEDCEVEINKVVQILEKAGPKSAIALSSGPNIELLRVKMTNFNFAGRSNSRTHVTSHGRSDTAVDYGTPNGLVLLHAKLITAQLKARASERRWRILIESCRRNQMSLSGSVNGDEKWCAMPTESGDGSSDDCCAKCCKCNNSACDACCLSCNRFWLSKFYGPSCRIAAIVCGAASCLILWSELVMASSLHSPIGLIMGGYDEQTQNSTVIQGVAFVVLSYMSLCTYWPLFRINIGWSYRLQGPQQSPPSSLIFNGEYFSRLQFSLGYNFLLAININRTHQTSFNGLIDNLAVIPIFGTSFTIYAPIIMVIVAIVTLFNGFSRFLALFNIETEDSYDCCVRRGGEGNEEIETKIKAGQAIVAAEIKRAQSARQDLVNTLQLSTLKSKAAATLTGKQSYINVDTTPPEDETSRHGYGEVEEDDDNNDDDDSQFSFNKTIGKYKSNLDFDEETGQIHKNGNSKNSNNNSNSNVKTTQPSGGGFFSKSTGNSVKNPMRSSTATAATNNKSTGAETKSSSSSGGGYMKTILGTQNKQVTSPTTVTSKATAGRASSPPQKVPVKPSRHDLFSLDDDDDEEELKKYRGRYD